MTEKRIVSNIETILKYLREYEFLVACIVVALIDLVLLFLGLWIWGLLLASFLGSSLLYKRPRYGMASGIIGILGSWLIFLNLRILDSLEAWSLFMKTILGIGGLGWLGLLLVFTILALIGALAGYSGASSTSLVLPGVKKRFQPKE
jgi:hypothetical protein